MTVVATHQHESATGMHVSLGHNCGPWDLRSSLWQVGSLVGAWELFSRGLWDLVPCPGIESGPPALGAWSVSHWTTRKSQQMWGFGFKDFWIAFIFQNCNWQQHSGWIIERRGWGQEDLLQIYLWAVMRFQTREGDGENKKRDEFLSFA